MTLTVTLQTFIWLVNLVFRSWGGRFSLFVFYVVHRASVENKVVAQIPKAEKVSPESEEG